MDSISAHRWRAIAPENEGLQESVRRALPLLIRVVARGSRGRCHRHRSVRRGDSSERMRGSAATIWRSNPSLPSRRGRDAYDWKERFRALRCLFPSSETVVKYLSYEYDIDSKRVRISRWLLTTTWESHCGWESTSPLKTKTRFLECVRSSSRDWIWKVATSR